MEEVRDALLATKRTKTQQRLAITAMWVEMYGAPPSDERFLRLTTREALEHIAIKQALEEWKKKQRSGADPDAPHHQYDTSEEAQSVADSPHWTGDAELDAIEAEETDPTRSGNLLDEFREWQQMKLGAVKKPKRKRRA